MGKRQLNLYIDDDLIELAKNSKNIKSISQEFNEWLRFRIGQNIENKPNMDIDIEIAKYKQEISKLQTQKELEKTQEFKLKEEIMVIDNIIDNEIDIAKMNNKKIDKWDNIIEERIHGLQYLFRKKFNKDIDRITAKNLLTDRLRERKLI